MKRVYLAGGMHTDWQEQVKSEVTGYIYLNPMDNQCKERDEFTFWDLSAVRECDIIFAYKELTNPTGHGTALEIGFAKALGKQIIFVMDEGHEAPIERAFGMCMSVSDVVFSDFEKAKDYLRKLELTFR